MSKYEYTMRQHTATMYVVLGAMTFFIIYPHDSILQDVIVVCFVAACIFAGLYTGYIMDDEE